MAFQEFLGDLRSLNLVEAELRGSGLVESRRSELTAQAAAIRTKLPTALLIHHDRKIRAGSPSLAAVNGSSCGGCHLRLPVGMLADLSQPGSIGVCPNCGVFVYKTANAPAAPTAAPEPELNKPARIAGSRASKSRPSAALSARDTSKAPTSRSH